MGNNEASNVIPISSKAAPINLSKAYLIASGTPILPREFVQPVDTAEALFNLASASEGAFLAEMTEISRALKLRTQYPGLKTIGRIAQKADHEKEGRVDHVFDAQRIAFIADRPSQIKKALDFFSPSKNSRVVELINQFAVPDPESRIRRAKIIYEKKEDGFAEIQIWASSMLNAFEESHKPYERQRKLKADLQNSGSDLPHKRLAQLQIQEKILGQTRCSIHDDAAAEAGLDKFIENRVFGRIGDTPIIAISRPKDTDTYPTILRPDAATGLYVVDNSLYSDFMAGKYQPTSRDDFLRASHNIASTQMIKAKRCGQELAIGSLTHLEIA